MSSYKDIMKFLKYVDVHLNNNVIPMKGGSTEPYNTYESIMDNIFDYTRFIFGNDEINKKELSASIDELDKCQKYKEEICKKDTYDEKNDSPINNIGFNETEEDKDYEEEQGVLLRKGKELE